MLSANTLNYFNIRLSEQRLPEMSNRHCRYL